MENEFDTDEAADEENSGPAIRTAEEWATAKGMLPRILGEPDVKMSASVVMKRGTNKRAIRIGAVGRTDGSARPGVQNPKFEAFHVARAHHAWPVGHELTEAEFDAAVVTAKTAPQFR